jgi:hypothetical protein
VGNQDGNICYQIHHTEPYINDRYLYILGVGCDAFNYYFSWAGQTGNSENIVYVIVDRTSGQVPKSMQITLD